MIRVGFIFWDSLVGWNGGINYYKNLISILLTSEKFTPIILCSPNLKTFIDKNFQNIEVKYFNKLKENSFFYKLRKLILYITGYNIFINGMLQESKIDIVSHNDSFPLNCNSRCKSCGWIPDFQSLHFPELFTRKSLRREKLVRKCLINNSTFIVVSSNAALEDLIISFPRTDIKKTKVFTFSLSPITKNIDYSIQILSKYMIYAYNYFLITNQFWAHKNHIIVLKALVELLKENKKINFKIVATGLQKDLRGSKNYDFLENFIHENKLENYFIMTGNIPYSKVQTLQHFSMAVIQPSLFEGWNTAVEECKQTGKKIILSNIPVHKEQNPENVCFFNPRNEKELAEILTSVSDNYDRNKEIKFEEKAFENQELVWKDFSKRYITLLDETLQGV